MDSSLATQTFWTFYDYEEKRRSFKLYLMGWFDKMLHSPPVEDVTGTGTHTTGWSNTIKRDKWPLT